MRRRRRAKIVATLGPASDAPETIRALFAAGADVFRLNLSHGTHAEHRAHTRAIRRLEREVGRPIGILMDLQGPKLRIGAFAAGPVQLAPGAAYRFDLSDEPGDRARAPLPHPEIFSVLDEDQELLLDDGKIRLRVKSAGDGFVETEVVPGGLLSDRKGVNIPGCVLPLSALTNKDREDLRFGLELGVDWVGLSFVQHPADIAEVRKIVAGRAAIMAKLEKPAAIDRLGGGSRDEQVFRRRRSGAGAPRPSHRGGSICS